MIKINAEDVEGAKGNSKTSEAVHYAGDSFAQVSCVEVD
jgi:hypothetical protein